MPDCARARRWGARPGTQRGGAGVEAGLRMLHHRPGLLALQRGMPGDDLQIGSEMRQMKSSMPPRAAHSRPGRRRHEADLTEAHAGRIGHALQMKMRMGCQWSRPCRRRAGRPRHCWHCRGQSGSGKRCGLPGSISTAVICRAYCSDAPMPRHLSGPARRTGRCPGRRQQRGAGPGRCHPDARPAFRARERRTHRCAVRKAAADGTGGSAAASAVWRGSVSAAPACTEPRTLLRHECTGQCSRHRGGSCFCCGA